MNDRQGEEGERREGRQECCCGVIVSREREGERGEDEGGMLDLLPYNGQCVDKEEQKA